MFDPMSRYADLPDATLTVDAADGRMVSYKQRRFLPPIEPAAAREHTLRQGERLDQLAATYLGDATRFWQICDASPVFDPDELIGEPGSVLRIALLPGGR